MGGCPSKGITGNPRFLKRIVGNDKVPVTEFIEESNGHCGEWGNPEAKKQHSKKYYC